MTGLKQAILENETILSQHISVLETSPGGRLGPDAFRLGFQLHHKSAMEAVKQGKRLLSYMAAKDTQTKERAVIHLIEAYNDALSEYRTHHAVQLDGQPQFVSLGM